MAFRNNRRIATAVSLSFLLCIILTVAVDALPEIYTKPTKQKHTNPWMRSARAFTSSSSLSTPATTTSLPADAAKKNQNEESLPGTNSSPPAKQQQQLTPQSQLRVLQASSFLIMVSTALVAFSPAPYLTQAWGADQASQVLSTISASAALLEMMLSPALGSILLDTMLGRKPIVVTALLAVVGAHLSVAVHPQPWTVGGAKFVTLYSLSLFFLANQAVTSDLVVLAATVDTGGSSSSSTGERLGAAMGQQLALVSGGFFVGALCAGSVASSLPFAYTVSAVIAFFSWALVFWGLPETLPVELRSPWNTRKAWKDLVAQFSPFSCLQLVRKHGSQVRTLAVLLLLASVPQFMGDVFQIYARKEWKLSTQEFSSSVALFGIMGIAANTVGSVLVRKLGIRSFLAICTLSSLCSPIGAVTYGFRGLLIGGALGFLGNGQQMGISAALMALGNQTGLPQGQLAGERSSFMALLKVIGPLWYSALYVQGGKLLGTRHLPFLFNVGLAVAAFVLSQTSLLEA